MKIEWVNHASFILEENGVRLICDPWLDGTAFDDGWGLLSPTMLSYEDFRSITHIWFSHEHPDHFSPPNLKKIPEDVRKNITVLYHATVDKKVIDYCDNLGFKNVIELQPDEWRYLSDDLRILNCTFGADSWLCVKNKDYTILNLNDCEVAELRDAMNIKKKVGDVDLLLSQFSYAGFAGNADDLAGRSHKALEKLKQMDVQIRATQPKMVIPFASFVWFCHEENYYMNKGINTVRDAYDFIAHQGAKPVVLYPGEVWNLADDHDSATSLRKYDVDYELVRNSPNLIRTKTVPIETLQETVNQYLTRVRLLNNNWLLSRFKDANVYITDYKAAYRLSIRNGLTKTTLPYEACDIALSSEAFNYCLRFAWGGETIWIAGRLQIPQYGNFRNFKNFTAVGGLNNHGIKFGLGFALSYGTRKMANKILAFMRRLADPRRKAQL